MTSLGLAGLRSFVWPPDATEFIRVGEDTDGTDGWSFPWDHTEVPDGWVYTDIGVTDGAGNGWRGGGHRFLVDRTPPTGRVTWPEENVEITENTTTIWAEASDNYAGVDRVTFYIWPPGEDNWLELGTDFTGDDGWSITWDHPAVEGYVSTDIAVVDRAGNGWRGGGTHFTVNRTLRLANPSFTPTILFSGQILRACVDVINNGETTISTQDPPPEFLYQEGETYLSIGYPESPGAFRMAVDYGNSSEWYSYRWGLGGDLPSGSSRTVCGEIAVDTPQVAHYDLGLVEELVRWWWDHTDSILITVEPSQTSLSSLVADFTGDCKIDAQDAQLLASAWRSRQGEQGYIASG